MKNCIRDTERNMGLDVDRVIEQDAVHSHLKCSICMDVLENPLQAPCQHTFCKQCISQWLNRGNNTCPEDRQKLSLSELKPPRVIQDLLTKLTIRCKNHKEGCRLLSRYEDMKKLIDHETNDCSTGNNSYRTENEILKQRNKALENELKNLRKSHLEAVKIKTDLAVACDRKQNVITSLEKKLSEKNNELFEFGKLTLTENYSYQVRLQMPTDQTVFDLEIPKRAIMVSENTVFTFKKILKSMYSVTFL